jgi:hypothetical protein
MKNIKLSGRERAVVRAIGFSTSTTGEQILEHTRIEPEELVEVLNGLITVGYAEMVPYGERTDLESFRQVNFEINPSYVLELREAVFRDM